MTTKNDESMFKQNLPLVVVRRLLRRLLVRCSTCVCTTTAAAAEEEEEEEERGAVIFFRGTLFNTTRWMYLKISKIEKNVSLDHTRNCIYT